MKRVLFLSLIIIILYPIMAEAVSISIFSVDRASPSIDENITPNDILMPGLVFYRQGSSLGLQDDDNLNALSFGLDLIDSLKKSPGLEPVEKSPWIGFSVDQASVGLPGSEVYNQAQPGNEEAAGDVYRTHSPFGSNILFNDEEELGLKPGDDIDALSFYSTRIQHIYFSFDGLSASNEFGAANDIYIDIFDPSSPFASGEIDIGLKSGDDLDALALWDEFEPGILNPGIDKALFSISTFSPSASDFSPADILYTEFDGSFSIWALAADIGLRADDELDAIAVPEPSSISLMFILLINLFFAQYYMKRKDVIQD